jgi:hypothetical protein
VVVGSLTAQVGALSFSLLMVATPTPTLSIPLRHLTPLEDRPGPSAKSAKKSATLLICVGTSSMMNSSSTLILLVVHLPQAMLIPTGIWILAPLTI